MSAELLSRNCWTKGVCWSSFVYVKRSLHVRPIFFELIAHQTTSTLFSLARLRFNLAVDPECAFLIFELFSPCVILVDQIGL